MVRVIKISLIIALLIIIGVNMIYSKQERKPLEPKKIIPKFIFGKEGKGLGEFDFPSGLVIKDNYLFIADGGNNRIQTVEIKADGSLIPKFIFGKEGKGLGEFDFPSGLVIKDNYLFIADGGNNRIQTVEINTNGNLIPKFIFGKKGVGLGEFIGSYETNLLAKDNYLFVTEETSDKIQILNINSDGSLSPKFTFGKEGKGLGEFSMLNGMAVKDNYVYIADVGNNRIQILNINSDGSLSPKFTFGKEGKDLGEFVTFSDPLFLLPGYINLAIKDNYLYIADAGNQRIQVFKINTDGSLLPKFSYGKPGNKLGEFGIPYGIAIKDNYLFVSDTGYHCIQVLKIKY